MLVRHDNGIDCCLEDRPIAALAFSQLLFGDRAFATLVAEIDEKKSSEPNPEQSGGPAQAGRISGGNSGIVLDPILP
jgi:hypothetical protein